MNFEVPNDIMAEFAGAQSEPEPTKPVQELNLPDPGSREVPAQVPVRAYPGYNWIEALKWAGISAGVSVLLTGFATLLFRPGFVMTKKDPGGMFPVVGPSGVRVIAGALGVGALAFVLSLGIGYGLYLWETRKGTEK